MTAGSRYFTQKSGHYPNPTAFVEVTADGRYLSHHDDGEVIEQAPAARSRPLDGCLGYVRSGHWIELQRHELANRPKWNPPRKPDAPLTVADAW